MVFKVLSLILVVIGYSNIFANPSYNWDSMKIGGGGFVSAIITHPAQEGLIYARTDVGGAYRWNPQDQTWIPLNDWTSQELVGYLGVESLAIDPQNPQRVYMLVGTSYFSNGRTAILRSDDYGETFDVIEVTNQFWAHGNGMGRQTGEKLIVDPNNSDVLYVGTRGNGLFRSIDRADTWERISSLNITTTPNENGISFVEIDENSSVFNGLTQTIYAGVSRTGDNLYRSTDGGTSWSAISQSPSTLMPHRAALADNGNMFITYADGAGPHGHWEVPEPVENGSVWRYNTTNDNWTDITPQGYTRSFAGVSLDPNNQDRVIVSTINNWMNQSGAHGDRFLISTNAGNTWRDILADGLTRDYNEIPWIEGHSMHWTGSIEFDPFNTSRVFVTSGNGIWMTEDIDAQTTNWIFQVKGIEETVPLDLVSIPEGEVISVIGDYDGFVHTNPKEYPPIHNPQMGTSTGIAFASNNTSFVVRAGDRLYFSTNQGQTWTEMNRPSNDYEKGKVAVSSDGEVILYAPGNSSNIYRTSNRGQNWNQVTGIQAEFPVADPVNSNKFYAYSGSAFYVSTDKGASFSQASTPGNSERRRIGVVFDREGHIWLARQSAGLMRSTNSGSSFTSVGSVSNCDAVGFGKAADNSDYPTVYIWGTVNNVTGLFKSVDQGANWIRINDDNHQYGGPGNGQFVIGDANVFGRVYMSSVGRGIIYGELKETTSVECDVEKPFVEQGYSLMVAPNPILSSATVIFSTTTKAVVDFELYTSNQKLIDSKKINSNGLKNNFKWELFETLPKGQYFIVMKINKSIKAVYPVTKIE